MAGAVQGQGGTGQFRADQGKGRIGKGIVRLERAGRARQFRTWHGRAV